jgi:hypothetical protein
MEQFVCHLEMMPSLNGARRVRNGNGHQKAQQTICDSSIVTILLPFQAPQISSRKPFKLSQEYVSQQIHTNYLDSLQTHVARQDEFLCLIPFHCYFPPWSSHRTVVLILANTSMFGRKEANSVSELQLGIWDRNSCYHLVHLFKVCILMMKIQLTNSNK